MPTKDEYIKKLNLTPHPEGGWYRQVYHSAKTRYDAISLASRYEYTSIYFILDGGSPSHLHRLLHSEVLDASSFGLVSCAVAPGFDYHDFELFTQDQLLAKYPEQAEVIKRVAYQKLPAE